jgi:hypothetical protein
MAETISTLFVAEFGKKGSGSRNPLFIIWQAMQKSGPVPAQEVKI